MKASAVASVPNMNGPNSTAAAAQNLCLACGLCCNGVLFKDVELQSRDDAAQLRSLGLPLKCRLARRNRPALVAEASNSHWKFPQPCAALGADGRCRVYDARPVRCRDFECALFKAVSSGRLNPAAALRVVRKTLQRADEVKRLLRELGDTNDTLALSLRFKRLRKRLDRGLADEETADLYAQLTLAVHDLNLRLRAEFYPGDGRWS